MSEKHNSDVNMSDSENSSSLLITPKENNHEGRKNLSEHLVTRQIKNLKASTKASTKTKFFLLLKSCYHYLTEGCNAPEHKSVKNSDPTEAAQKSFDSAKEIFSNPEKAKDFFCDCHSPVIPITLENGAICIQSHALLVAVDVLKTNSENNYLKSLVSDVFSSSSSLNGSFLTAKAFIDHSIISNQDACLDYKGLVNAYKTVQQLKNEEINNALGAAIQSLCNNLARTSKSISTAKELRQFIILLLWQGFLEPTTHSSVQKLMKAILQLSSTMTDTLCNQLSKIPKKLFSHMISIFQQYITIQLYMLGYIDENIAYATRVIGVLNEANERKPIFSERVDYNEFYNDGVNNIVDLKQDYIRWRHFQDKGTSSRPMTFEDFSFTNYPFILDPSSKTKILQVDAQAAQNQELQKAVFSTLISGAPISNLYLVLKVRRENLLHNTIHELETKSHDLKKQLRVVFIGEEGVDEGGVKKEFFQLIVRQIFDLNFGMFTYNSESRTFWFNQNSLANEDEFQLIGTIIGLAIYNSVILDVHFPLTVYRKLLGREPTLEDLKEADPSLGKGLQQLLDFDGDVEETYCRTFQVESEVYGKIQAHDLKPNGSKIPVTNENRKEYVDLFVKWKLKDSVKKQFDAFAEGFHNVCGGPILKLFRPEELELLVCGSPVLDFDALERGTKYADGYSKDHRIVKEFWEIVKGFALDQKKKFLSFCTGSDRVPIRGLGNLGFVIIRNGPDSDRLPTAHTCFNYLLLPEYKTKEKLKERLTTAIENFEGFGLQ